ncbi:hypothetical protein Lal_00021960 [Lupinus albus]|nr:hypothetical protein Lal_00021960 [Lupinus albus]
MSITLVKLQYMTDSTKLIEKAQSGVVWKKITMIWGSKSNFEVFPHIPSLISLKDAVKGNNVELQNLEDTVKLSKMFFGSRGWGLIYMHSEVVKV